MPSSPLHDADAPLRLTILSNGTALPDSCEVLSVEITKTINRIPLCVLTFNDGDMPEKDFPLSNLPDLAPGAELVVNAGYGHDEQQLFSGVVVKHSISISGHNQARLVVECRDKIFAAALARNNANYVSQTDSDVISSLLAKYPVTADVSSTSETLPELVQYYCTDWDFMLIRAEVNGLLVIADDGSVSVTAPEVSGEAVLSITYGSDLISFNASVDASQQFSSVKAVSWDHNQQQIQNGSASPAELTGQGNLSSTDLAEVAGVSEFRLQSTVPLSNNTLQSWANAQQLKSALARVRGELSCQGAAMLKPGVLVDVDGVGERFNGKVYIIQVRHVISQGNWLSYAGFGLSPQWFAQHNSDISAPFASGVIPGVGGLQTAVVMKLDADPDNACRVQVRIPLLEAETEGVWARLLSYYASGGFGHFCLPEIGDEVILGYLNNDPCYPVILGSVYSSKHKPPYDPTAENTIKAFVSRSKLTLEYDEEKKKISIFTPGGNKAVLDDDTKSILLQDQNGNKVQLSDSGILLDSPKDISISAKGKISLQAVNNVEVSAQADVKTQGLNISQQANVSFTAKGAASAELSASGQTTVKGAMVMIN